MELRTKHILKALFLFNQKSQDSSLTNQVTSIREQLGLPLDLTISCHTISVKG